jgi:hypothetical protein
MKVGIYIVILVIFLIVRLIIKVAKTANNPPPPRQNPNPYNNPPMKQPPPYVPPSQQPTTDFSTLFEEQKSSYQSPNPFTNPVSPPPFNATQDSFSNIPSRNTHSNMGAGSQSYYCMYCGKKFQSIAALKMDTCFRHPKADQGLQKHVLYTGMGKPNIGF